MSSTNKSREKYSDARLNSDEFNDTFIHICLYIYRHRQSQTARDRWWWGGWCCRLLYPCSRRLPTRHTQSSFPLPPLQIETTPPPPSPFPLPPSPSPLPLHQITSALITFPHQFLLFWYLTNWNYINLSQFLLALSKDTVNNYVVKLILSL